MAEHEVCARSPLALDPRVARELRHVAVAFDRLLRRLADAMLSPRGPARRLTVPDFPALPELLATGPLGRPYFWGRFDVFERAEGGLAVLEYNCDKPTSQREIWASAEAWRGAGNAARGTRAAFRRALRAAWARHVASRVAGARRAAGGERVAGSARGARPRVVILVDPSHREELHLAYLYGAEVARLGWPWDVVGPDNLRVERDRAIAYGAPVDIVVRQYPTEFLQELPAFAELCGLARAGRLLWLNDPRALLAQAKSTLALLWAEGARGRWLSAAERRLVRRHLPPTGLASEPGWLERARARPESWVLKPVFGRFSEGVAVGALLSAEAWTAALAGAAARPHAWIVQAYVAPRRRWLPGPGAARGGHVNWGVYLVAGRPAGLLARCQPSALTDEATSWWAPVRLRRAPLPRPTVRHVVRLPLGRGARRWPGPGAAWTDIADRGALAGYTNAWTDGLANFSLAAVGLHAGEWDALAHATAVVGRAVGRVLAHLERAPDLLALVGVPPRLVPLAARGAGRAPWSFVSRLDWAHTPDGWKLLEINSDTPAGLWEAGWVAGEIARRHRGGAFVGGEFWTAFAARWAEAAAAAGAPEAPRIALVGAASYPEDADQMRAHARAIGLALPGATTEIAAIGALQVRDGRPWLRGAPMDLVFRYYPLDWIAADPALAPLLALAEAGAPSILPPAHALVPQSKAFLALVWELERQGFFPAEESAAVRAHVPLTVLDVARLGGRPHVVKPYLEREGQGVRFSAEVGARERRRIRAAEVVYQARVALARARLPVATARGWRGESRSLVFGVFLIGDRVAGAYTRAGAPITGREAVFAPLCLT